MDNINNDNFDLIEKDVKEFRYVVIENAILIESMISTILTNFLGNELTKKVLHKHLFSDAITFEKKVILFSALNNEKVFAPTIGNKELNRDLDYIKKLRNLMAHSQTDISSEIINKLYKNELKFFSYTQKGEIEIVVKFNFDTSDEPQNNIYSYNVLIDKINKSTDALLQIINWLSSKCY